MSTAIQLDALALESPAYSNGHAAGFAKASDTSKDAATHINKTLGNRNAEVLGALKLLGGSATGAEVAAYLKFHPYIVRPRLTNLTAQGLVVDSGERRNRQTIWRVAA